LARLVAAAERRGLDDREGLPPDDLRDYLQIGQLQGPADRGDLVRQSDRPLAVGIEDLLRPLELEEQRAGIELADRDEVKLDRRDDAEVPAAGPQSPEQLGLVFRIDRADLAVGGDDLDRRYGVGLDAVLPDHPADAAAE